MSISTLSYADIHYVSKTGTNTAPYTTPETASLTIANALTASTTGDTVYVYNGTYAEAVTISKNITLTGESQAGVIIQPTSDNVITVSSGYAPTISTLTINVNLRGSTGLYATSLADNFILSNVTVKNVNGTNGSGINLTMAASATGTISNLVVQDCPSVAQAIFLAGQVTSGNWSLSGITITNIQSSTGYLIRLHKLPAGQIIDFSSGNIDFTSGSNNSASYAIAISSNAALSKPTIQNLTLTQANNIGGGIIFLSSYVFGYLANAVLNNIDIDLSGTPDKNGIYASSLQDGFSITNVTVKGVDGASSYPLCLPLAASATGTISGVTIEDCPNVAAAIYLSGPGSWSGLSGITITNVQSAAGYLMRLSNLLEGQIVDFSPGNIDFTPDSGNSSSYAIIINCNSTSYKPTIRNLTMTKANNDGGGITIISSYSYGYYPNAVLENIYIDLSDTTNKNGIYASGSLQDGFSITNVTIKGINGASSYPVYLSMGVSATGYISNIVIQDCPETACAIRLNGQGTSGDWNLSGTNTITNVQSSVSGNSLIWFNNLPDTQVVDFSTDFTFTADGRNATSYAIKVSNGKPTIKNLTLTMAMNDGGGIYLYTAYGYTANAVLQNISMDFTGGTAGQNGIYCGGVLQDGFSLSNITIEGINNKDSYGAVLNMASGAIGSISGLTIQDCPDISGALILAGPGTWNTLTGITISNVTSLLPASYTNGYIRSFLLFLKNLPDTQVIDLSSSNFNFVAGSGNNALWTMWVSNGKPTIQNLTLTTAMNNGSGIYLYTAYGYTPNASLENINIDLTGTTDKHGIYTNGRVGNEFSATNITVKGINGSSSYGFMAVSDTSANGSISGLTVQDCPNVASAVYLGGYSNTSNGWSDLSNITIANVQSAAGYLVSLVNLPDTQIVDFDDFTFTADDRNAAKYAIRIYGSSGTRPTIKNLNLTKAMNNGGGIYLQGAYGGYVSAALQDITIDLTGTTGKSGIYGYTLRNNFSVNNVTVRGISGEVRAVWLGLDDGHTGSISGLTISDCSLTGSNHMSTPAALHLGNYHMGHGLWTTLENITFRNITGPQWSYIFTVDDLPTEQVIDFSKFTFENNAVWDAICISTYNTKPTLKNLTLTAAMNNGNGIMFHDKNPYYSSSRAVLENINIDLTGTENKNGIHSTSRTVGDGTSIKNCVVTGAKYTSVNTYPIYLNLYSGVGTISNVTISGNIDTQGCIRLIGTGTWNVSNSVIALNPGSTYISKGSCDFNWTNNDVYKADGDGGTLFSGMADPTGADDNISADPLFATSGDDNYYLGQLGGGQASTSPCVDKGSDTAENLSLGETAGFGTRTDGAYDAGTVDMGYHYTEGAGIWITDIDLVDVSGSDLEEIQVVQDTTSQEIIVRLRNENGDLATVPADTTITLETTSATGSFATSESGPWTQTTSFNVTIPSGSYQVSVWYKDATPSGVTPYTITAYENPSQDWVDPDTGSEPELAASILSSVNDFTIEPTDEIYNKVSGVAFSLTITALNDEGATATTYTGPARITDLVAQSPTTGVGTFTPSTTTDLTFTEGVCVIENASYDNAGSIKLTVTDQGASGAEGTSATAINFIPYDFVVTPDATDQVVNRPFELTITPRNAEEQTCTYYTGTANLTIGEYVIPATDQSGIVTPASLTASYWTNGVATLDSATYDKWGTVKIRCTDGTLDTQYGESVDITFHPQDFGINIPTPPVSRDYFYTNEDIDVTIAARDYALSTIDNYQGTVTFTGSSFSLPDDYEYTTTDAGQHIFQIAGSSEGDSLSFNVEDTLSSASQTASEGVTIKEGSIAPSESSYYTPIDSPMAITVNVIDSSGEVLSGDDSTTFYLTLTEANDDSSCRVSSSYAGSYSLSQNEAFTITDGSVTLYIKDSQPELVTITPSDATPTLTCTSSTITFGSMKGATIVPESWRDKGETGRRFETE